MRYELPKEELLYSGHIGCPGCGASLAMRYTLQALGKKTMVVIPACCWSTVAGFFPSSSLKVPILHCLFETAAISASGVKKGLIARGIEDVQVMAWAGDGGTFDIGLQSLSGCAERNDDIIYVCYDNEAYMNTGIQRSSATPLMSWTSTTPNPAFKETPKKDIMEIMAAHRIPYAATVSPAFPEDFLKKMGRAKETRGFRFIHFSYCPLSFTSFLEPRSSCPVFSPLEPVPGFRFYPFFRLRPHASNLEPFLSEKPIPHPHFPGWL